MNDLFYSYNLITQSEYNSFILYCREYFYMYKGNLQPNVIDLYGKVIGFFLFLDEKLKPKCSYTKIYKHLISYLLDENCNEKEKSQETIKQDKIEPSTIEDEIKSLYSLIDESSNIDTQKESHEEYHERMRMMKELIEKNQLGMFAIMDAAEGSIQELCSKLGQLLFDFSMSLFSNQKRVIDRINALNLSVNLDKINYRPFNSLYDPKFIYELVCILNYICDLRNIYLYIHKAFESEDSRMLTISSLVKYDYGYDVYCAYIEFCKKNNITPLWETDSPDLILKNKSQNSKITPLKSKCSYYYPTLSFEEAKRETIKSYEIIYGKLVKVKYLMDDCCIDDFLWVFGLREECPKRFRKIAFHSLTSRTNKSKGNGALLSLLYILGYTEDEITQLVHRNKKEILINQLFDLTITHRTLISADYDILLDIVKSSNLPIGTVNVPNSKIPSAKKQ